MQQRGLVRKAAASGMLAVAVAAFGLAGCGTGANGGGGGNSVTSKALKIATEFPVSGGDAADTIPAQNGVDLAVSQNANLGGGYTLSVVHYNDEGTSGADPATGAANVQKAIADSSIMGIVGPFNSGVAVSEIPVVNAGHIVEVSPTNTNPGLTLQQYAAANNIDWNTLHPAGSTDYYFRVCPNDVDQGKADAEIALSPQVNAKKIFTIDDTTTYGKGLVNYFTTAYTAAGGTVVNHISITPQEVSTFPTIATQIIGSGATAVFYGGVTSQGGAALKAALAQAGFKGAMVGGDGIADDPGFIKTAGAAAAGTVGTVAAPDLSALTTSAATAFEAAYKAKFQGAELTPYSAQAYDAAMIEIDALKALIKANKPITRDAVRNQVASINYSGVIGTITFDANGDNSGSKVFSVWAVMPGSTTWTFQQDVTV